MSNKNQYNQHLYKNDSKYIKVNENIKTKGSEMTNKDKDSLYSHINDKIESFPTDQNINYNNASLNYVPQFP